MVRLICRLEKIVFGNPSDIIDNLLNDKSEKVKDEKTKDDSVEVSKTIVDNSKDSGKDSEDSEVESDQDISVLNCSDDTRPKEKEPAWIDEDDYNYT